VANLGREARYPHEPPSSTALISGFGGSAPSQMDRNALAKSSPLIVPFNAPSVRRRPYPGIRCRRPWSDGAISFQCSSRCLPFSNHGAIASPSDFDIAPVRFPSLLLETVEHVDGLFELQRYNDRSLTLQRRGMQLPARVPRRDAAFPAWVIVRAAPPAAPRTTPLCKADRLFVSDRIWCRN
jgi:hypothetical protein